MTDTQLIVVTLWTLFAILVLAAVYVVESVLRRLEQNFARPLEKIEQRLYTTSRHCPKPIVIARR